MGVDGIPGHYGVGYIDVFCQINDGLFFLVLLVMDNLSESHPGFIADN